MSTNAATFRHPKALCLFALAMGILESIVVVYLRRIYYPEGFSFPLVAFDSSILRAEVTREAMTLVMLASVAWIAGANAWGRFLAFLVLFGAWDLAYYAGLALFLDWPGSFLEPDILFLIPKAWIGPVLAPILVASAWVATGFLLRRTDAAGAMGGWPAYLGAAASGVLILASFLIHVGPPEDPGFPWGVFAAGYGVGAAVAARSVLRARGPGMRAPHPSDRDKRDPEPA